MVERSPEKAGVGGSIPSLATIKSRLGLHTESGGPGTDGLKNTNHLRTASTTSNGQRRRGLEMNNPVSASNT